MKLARVVIPLAVAWGASLAAAFGQEDVTAPDLVALLIDTPFVDTSGGPVEVSFTIRVQDDLSGFDGDNVSFVLRKPGDTTLGGPFCRIVGGTLIDSIQECAILLPRYSEAGTWRIESLFLRDEVGNSRAISGSALQASGFPTQIVNSGGGQDVVAPEVVGFVVNTMTINTGEGPDTARFTVQVVDDLSGFDGDDVAFQVRRPRGGSIGGPYCRAVGSAPLRSTQECSLTLPRYSEIGTWSVAALSLSDAAGNSRWVSSEELRARGFETTFVNEAAVEDVRAPDLTGLVVNTPLVDTTSGPDTVRFTVQVADDVSGFDGDDVAFALRKPTGEWLGGPFCRIVGGTATDSTQECSLTLPQFSPLGTWTIGQVSLGDAAGNWRGMTEADLRAAGFSIDFVNAPGDGDGDGVLDTEDSCPATSSGAVVDARGCSIAQLAPCAGPVAGGQWKNHGEYVSAVEAAAEEFLAEGLITGEEMDLVLSEAGRSSCGAKRP